MWPDGLPPPGAAIARPQAAFDGQFYCRAVDCPALAPAEPISMYPAPWTPLHPALIPAPHPTRPVYLVNPSGEFAALWPKDVTIPLLSDAVSRAVKE